MGKYTFYRNPPPKPRDLGVHPVMRGIGCIMMILVPIVAYGASLFVIDYGIRNGWPIPPEWLGRITIPAWLMQWGNLGPLWSFLSAQNNLIAVVIFTIVITIVIGGLMSIIYGYLYALFGPPQYGPQDAPPIRAKVKRYRR
jgi:hypothetical protein